MARCQFLLVHLIRIAWITLTTSNLNMLIFHALLNFELTHNSVKLAILMKFSIAHSQTIMTIHLLPKSSRLLCSYKRTKNILFNQKIFSTISTLPFIQSSLTNIPSFKTEVAFFVPTRHGTEYSRAIIAA